MRYLIIVSKTSEIADIMEKDPKKPELNTDEWMEWYDSYHIDGSVVPLQTEFKELKEKFKLRKDITIYPSEIFSYQNQGIPTKKDVVILVNGMDRYGYCLDGIPCHEFNNYNDRAYSLDIIDRLVNPVKIINYTPHDIILGDVVIEPSGFIARCEEIVKGTEKVFCQYGEFTIIDKDYSDVTIIKTTNDSIEVGVFPEFKEGIIYIVSAMCAGKLKGRKDVIYPGDMIRDKLNRIVGCRSFTRTLSVY